jgi:hypothetical protein
LTFRPDFILYTKKILFINHLYQLVMFSDSICPSEDSKRGIANLFIKKDNMCVCINVDLQMEIHVLFVFNLYYDELTYTLSSIHHIILYVFGFPIL